MDATGNDLIGRSVYGADGVQGVIKKYENKRFTVLWSDNLSLDTIDEDFIKNFLRSL